MEQTKRSFGAELKKHMCIGTRKKEPLGGRGFHPSPESSKSKILEIEDGVKT